MPSSDSGAPADVTGQQPANNTPTTPANLQHSTAPQADQHLNVNVSAPQTADNSTVQRDEVRKDSSDGLWSLYLREVEKADKRLTESWKGDTDGIIVFTGLFSATVAAFIVESYKKLSPDPGDTTNALLTQLSVQLFNISHGIPLPSVAAPSSQSFTPKGSAIRVNVFWFLSLVLSLNCALSATLMQQWTRRYQELAQRRGAIHKHGRMRAYILDGISNFGMARAVATMPTLLHISVFLFFAGLVEFLIPIHKTVAYVTLGCVAVFALAYTILTVLPILYHDCPYGTPMSELTWRISQFSVFAFFWTVLKLEGPLSKLWCFDNRQAKRSLEYLVKTYRQRFSQSLRESVESSAYEAETRVVTKGLEWTLKTLRDDEEIEEFTAQVPGFFDSHDVTDATSALLPLMFPQRHTDITFGSRLYRLLETCTQETPLPDKEMLKERLLVCLTCMWYFAKAYNLPILSQPLPSVFPSALASLVTTHIVQTKNDPHVRVIGRCFLALIVNKLADDLDSEPHTVSISDGKLANLPTILGTERHDVERLRSRPGAVAIANMISLTFGEVGSLATDTVPSDVLDVVRQTLATLSQTFLAQENAEDRTTAIINGSDGKFERMLLSRLLDLLKTCIPLTSPLTQEEPPRARCLQMCLKGLWYFGRAFNQPGKPVSLPSYICIAFSNPETIRLVREERDFSIRVTGRCAEALVVNKLATDITSRTGPVSAEELACVSAILGAGSHDVELLLSQPDAVPIANMISLTFGEIDNLVTDTVPSDVLDVVRQTLAIFSQAIPVQENAEDRTIAIINGSDGKFEHMLLSRLLELLKTCIPLTPSLTQEERTICLRMCLKGLWHFGRAFNQPGKSLGVPLASDICIAFSNPKMTPLIREERDFSVRVIGRCAGALAVNKLATDIIIRAGPVRAEEQACLSAILGTKSHDVKPLLSHLDAIKFTNIVFLALDNVSPFRSDGVPLDVLDVTKQTFSILTQALPDELNTKMQLDPTSILTGVSGGTSYHTAEMYNNFSRVCLKNLWSFTRTYNGPTGSSLPLPPYVCIAFANPEMARRIRPEGDLAAREIGRCVGALVVNKLATDITSRTGPVSAEELACVSAVLGVGSHDVRLCLRRPGTVELVNMAFLALGDVSSLKPSKVPRDVRDVLQQTLGTLTQALPAEENVDLQVDQMDAHIDASNNNFERTVVSRLHSLLKTCTSGASPLTEEVRRSCLRVSLKSLWRCGKAHHQLDTSDPLPSYFPLTLASPNIIVYLRTEQDPVARMLGCCFGALIASKLVDDLGSPTSLGGYVQGAELACILAILGIEKRGDSPLPLPHLLHFINFWNVVSLMSGESDLSFTAAGIPADMLDIAQDTLHILADHLSESMSVFEGLPMDQRQLPQEIYSGVVNALRSDQPNDQTMETIDQLRQILETLPSTEERIQNTSMQNLGP